MATVVVYGPMACGKTTHSGHLLTLFDAAGVVDDWDPFHQLVEPNCLHLTFCDRELLLHAGVNCALVSFDSLTLPQGIQVAEPEQFRRARPRKSYTGHGR
jgi:hypothetical protein